MLLFRGKVLVTNCLHVTNCVNFTTIVVLQISLFYAFPQGLVCSKMLFNTALNRWADFALKRLSGLIFYLRYNDIEPVNHLYLNTL